MEPFGFSYAGLDLQSKYKVCGNLKIGLKCKQLISLLPNNPRAARILESIDDAANNAKVVDPIVDADEVVTGLLLCASYAVSAVYNAPNPPKTKTNIAPRGLFTALNNYAISSLNCSPVPPLLQAQPTTHRAARRDATERDSRSVHKYSGPRCVFTGIVQAQAAHIIPVDTAGGVSRKRWFWLWLMIVLPPEELNQAWKACGGRCNNSISNVIMLCHPLHELYDAMSITFRPIDTDTPDEGYSLIIESSLGDIPLHGLHDYNDNPLGIGSQVDWQPQATATLYPTPVPFLFAVHRYFCGIRALMPAELLRSPPGPAPEIPDMSSFVQAWDEIAATPRTSAAATPASSAASSSIGASDDPRPSAAALTAALERVRNPGAAGYDGAGDFYAEDSDEEQEEIELYGRRMTEQELYEIDNSKFLDGSLNLFNGSRRDGGKQSKRS